MNYYADKYSYYIIHRLLRLEVGEKLSINCTDDTIEFAHKVAHDAAEVTGVDSNIVYINKGKAESVDIISPEFFQSEQKGIAMLNLLTFPLCNIDKNINVISLQEFRHLAEPIVFGRKISIPWAIAYVPSALWAEFCFLEGATTDQIWHALAEIFDLENVETYDESKHLEKGISNKIEKLNSLDIDYIHLLSPSCDLKLKKANDTKIGTSVIRLNNGRIFYPNIANAEIIIALDITNASGNFSTTYPFRFFDKIVNSASFTLENGKILNYLIEGGNENLQKLMNFDLLSANVGELYINESLNRYSLYYNSLALPSLDRSRTTTLSFGGISPDLITLDNDEALEKSNINTAISHLEFPLGSKDLNINIVNKKGEVITIMKDGELLI